MPAIPSEAVMAAAIAIERELLSGKDYSMAQDSDEALARVALEAAAPILAEQWGVADSERMRELIRANNQNLLAAAAEYYRLAYPGAAKEEP